MPLLDHLSDREVLLSVAQKVEEINVHIIQQNGRLARVEQATQGQAVQIAQAAGGLAFARWAFAALFIVMSTGAALAGVVLAVVARGN